jgi:hypothetical protein
MHRATDVRKATVSRNQQPVSDSQTASKMPTSLQRLVRHFHLQASKRPPMGKGRHFCLVTALLHPAANAFGTFISVPVCRVVALISERQISRVNVTYFTSFPASRADTAVGN